MTKKPTSKIATVIRLAQRKAGTTIADIVEKLGISKVAAASLVGDARRKGVKLKNKDRRYYA